MQSFASANPGPCRHSVKGSTCRLVRLRAGRWVTSNYGKVVLDIAKLDFSRLMLMPVRIRELTGPLHIRPMHSLNIADSGYGPSDDQCNLKKYLRLTEVVRMQQCHLEPFPRRKVAPEALRRRVNLDVFVLPHADRTSTDRSVQGFHHHLQARGSPSKLSAYGWIAAMQGKGPLSKSMEAAETNGKSAVFRGKRVHTKEPGRPHPGSDRQGPAEERRRDASLRPRWLGVHREIGSRRKLNHA